MTSIPSSEAPPPAAPLPVVPLPAWLAIVLVGGTSAAVLVLEILAARLLAPYVGVSLETYTGIIATVLAGISVGAWAGGWAADRIDPRRLLPLLLVVGGGLALFTIPTVRVLGDSAAVGPSGVILLASFGFLPSATVLSAIPPAVVKLQLRDLHDTGSVVGRLSAWGTAGAIVGTLVTGFVLVAVAAVTTLIVAVGVLLLATGVAFWAATSPAARRATGRTMAAGLAFAALAGGAVLATDDPCDTQTRYYCVSIDDDSARAGGRVLVLDDLRHSYVDIDDPTHLEFWYTQRFAEAIDGHSAPGPIDVVHVGGGALTVPQWLRTTRPGSDQVVLEIDGDLVDLVIDEFDIAVGAATGVDVSVGDARLAVDDLGDDRADVVVGDAFGSRSVPWHLATVEFVREVERVLVPGGLYVLNVIDNPDQDFLRAEAATLAAVFEHVTVILGPGAADGRLGNSVIVASDRPFDPTVVDPDGGRVVDDLAGFIGGAEILTDDFAPVDQLISGGT